MARAIPKRLLKEIAESNPAEVDTVVLTTAAAMLSLRSDDADAVALVYYDHAGQVLGYDVHGDTSGFPELEGQEQPQPALETKRADAVDSPGA